MILLKNCVDFNLKKEFNIVFQPITKTGTKRKRFLISVNRLPDYVGEKWAGYAIKKLLRITSDKERIKFRHIGFIDAYRK